MWYHLYLRKRIHIITDLTANGFTDVLNVIKPFDNAIIVKAKKQRAAKSIGKSTYALQPAFRSLFFKHQLEVVCSTFAD